jgi:hypothetical protein
MIDYPSPFDLSHMVMQTLAIFHDTKFYLFEAPI